MSETLRHFDAFSASMHNDETPINAETAKNALSEHENVFSSISAVSIDALKADVDNVSFPVRRNKKQNDDFRYLRG